MSAKLPFPHSVVATLLDCQPNGGSTPFLSLCLAHPECFDDLKHSKTVSTIKSLRDAGLPVHADRVAQLVDFQGASDFLIGLGACSLPLPLAEREAENVWQDYTRRQAKALLATGADDLDKRPDEAGKIIERVGSDLARLNTSASRDGLPDIVDAAEFLAEEIPLPPELLQGVVYQGSKLAIGGGSKTYKTWNLIALGVAVAGALKWLGRFSATKGKVLYVNFEISRAQWQRRVNAVAKAMNVELKPGDISLWNLRGHASDYETIIPKIIARTKSEDYALIILDPIYKLYGDADENSARDIAKLLNMVERLSTETRATVAYANHFAKGDASQKQTADRISGSGVFVRDPDALIIFTAHESPDSFTVETVLRDFPSVPPFVVSWDFPLMVRNDDLDPTRLKQNGGRPLKHRPDDLLALLPMTKPGTGNTAHLATRARPRPRGRITWQIAEAVADLVSLRGTEREACAAMQPPLSYSTWQHWKGKARNAEQFQQIVERITANKIKYHFGVLEHASAGTGGFAKRDFRASVEFLKLAIPRYQPAASAQAAVTVNVARSDAEVKHAMEYVAFLRRLKFLEAEERKGAIVDVKEVKQLPAPVESERVEPPRKLPPMFVKEGKP